MLKTVRILIVMFLLVLVVGCKPRTPTMLAPQPTPIPAPQPTSGVSIPSPTPSATPLLTPQARIAPEGTLYVVKPFSVTTEDGIHGFAAGKKVTLVRVDIDRYIVTNGTIEGGAPKDSFTNDMDVADALNAKSKQIAQTIQQSQNADKNLLAQQETANAKAVQQEKAATVAKNVAQNVAVRKEQLAALNNRIDTARRERTRNGYPADGGPRYTSYASDYNYGYRYRYSHIHSVTLSSDASQIEALLATKAQIESQLSKMGARP